MTRKTIKQVFWQTSIDNKRPKLKIQINGIVIEGLLDAGTDITIISPKSWHPDWPLLKINIQLPGIETLSKIKQSTKYVNCIRPEGKVEKLKLCMTNIAMFLWGHDLLQQWKTQSTIPSKSEKKL